MGCEEGYCRIQSDGATRSMTEDRGEQERPDLYDQTKVDESRGNIELSVQYLVNYSY